MQPKQQNENGIGRREGQNAHNIFIARQNADHIQHSQDHSSQGKGLRSEPPIYARTPSFSGRFKGTDFLLQRRHVRPLSFSSG
jgi:hypothetical protein